MILMSQLLWAQCTFTATSSGNNASFVQVYVLTDVSGIILDQNSTGTFSSISAGTYHIHALNYNPLDIPAPLPSALIGQNINLVGTTSIGCFNPDFLTDYVTKTCGTCYQTRTICETDPLVVSTTGEFTPYTQLYVLVDAATGLIHDMNVSGDFTGLVTAGTSYQIYALNYDPSSAPNPLPIIGQNVNVMGSISAGCYNSDYFQDYLCYNVTACLTNCFKSSTYCVGDNLVATTSGENSAYTQIFILTDATGNYVENNTTGIFSSNSLLGTAYRVYALNFDPNNPPSVLPTALNVGDPISNISGGCMNSDFLTDFVCFNESCVVLDLDVLTLTGKKISKKNKLDWNLGIQTNIAAYHLERSEDGQNNFQLLSSNSRHSSPNYSFIDDKPLINNYYRVRYENLDGTFGYSNLVYLDRTEDLIQNFELYPNPTSEQITLGFETLNSDNIQVSITNVLGQIIQNQEYITKEGSNKIQLNVSSFSKGMYYLQIKSNNWTVNQKIIKE